MEIKSITKELYSSILKPINKYSNKGSNGTLSIIAGSGCYRGAACLAVGGAMKTGVGIVRLASVEASVACTAARYPSATFLPVIADSEGMMDYSAFSKRADVIYKKSSAILLGCGLGQGEGTAKIVGEVLGSSLPLVLDADGLNLISYESSVLKKRVAETVITPHIGEMSRLCGKSISEIKNDRQGTAIRFAREYGVTVVLKDDVTFVASPSGEIYESSIGNEGLAKGGSGDVLAGFIGGFLAQGYTGVEASVLGLVTQGLLAKSAAQRLGIRAMRPEDILAENFNNP